MSFASEVKAEIALVQREPCCERAQLAAMLQLLSSLTITSSGLALTIRTENPTIAKKIWKLTKSLYDVETELSVIKKMKLKKNNIYVVKILEKTRDILTDVGLWTADGLQAYPAMEIVSRPCCVQAYLAGCFLAGGSVNSPIKTNYHLEIAVNHKEHATFIVKMLKRVHLPAKMIERRKQTVVYLKAADSITDFLALVGAVEASFQYADVKIQRDYVNNITRLENCATANDVKSVQAGIKQTEAVEWLEREKGSLDFLDEKLRDIAMLRKEYPDSSLQELADLYEKRTGTVLSKSGMKHRLNKLVEMAEKLKNTE